MFCLYLATGLEMPYIPVLNWNILLLIRVSENCRMSDKQYIPRSDSASYLGLHCSDLSVQILMKIKALTAPVCRLSLIVGRENGAEHGLKTVSFDPFWNSSKQNRPWSDAGGVWSGSALFTNVPNVPVNLLCTALWHYSDKNSAAINNRYLDFVLRKVWLHW